MSISLTSRRLVSSAAVLAGCLVCSTAHGVTMSPFTPNNPIGGGPIGWTFAGNKFVGSILDTVAQPGTNLLYSTDLTGNSVTPFGGTQVLAPTYGQEHFVASSFGLGGFAVGDVFAASGNNIVHYSNAGVSTGNFISGSTGGIVGDVRGIMFDTVGTFGNDMIVTTHAGNVYRVNSAGVPTLIASTGEDTEGADICPTNGTWGTFNGWLFVGSENSGTIRAIKPGAYTMVSVATVPSAEQVSFVPMNLGASGSPLEGMYSANWGVNVLKAGTSEFTGMQGDLIVTGETNSTIYQLSSGNAPVSVGTFPNQPEDGIFVTADILSADSSIPEPTSLSLLVIGTCAATLRRCRRTQ